MSRSQGFFSPFPTIQTYLAHGLPKKKVNISLDSPSEYDELLDFLDNISTHDTDVKEQLEAFYSWGLLTATIELCLCVCLFVYMITQKIMVQST